MRKLYIACICFVLCLGLFAGCGNGKDPKQTSTPVPGGPTTPEGKVYIKSGDNYRGYYYTISKENEIFQDDSLRSTALRERLEEYKDKYGLTVTFVPFRSNWFEDFLASAFANAPIAEFMFSGGPHTMNQQYLYNDIPGSALGCFTDYNYVATFDDPEYWDVEAQKYSTYGGKLYHIVPRRIGLEACNLNQVTFFNHRMVRDAGYDPEYLYQLNREGKWTWAIFEEIAIATTKPEHDQYGLCLAQENSLAYNLMISNGGDYIQRRVVDGVEMDRFTATEPEALQAWDFFLKLAKEDKVVRPNTLWGEANGFATGQFAMMLTYINRTDIIANEMEDDYGMIMVPKPTEDAEYVSACNWWAPHSMFANIQNPEGVVQFMNMFYKPIYAMSSQEAQDLFEAEIGTIARDEGSVETCRMTMEAVKIQPIMVYMMEVQDLLWNKVDMLINGEVTPSAYFASIEGAVNAVIDKYTKAIEQG